MQAQPATNANAIYQEIVAYIASHGRPYKDWYAGITGDVSQRLFTKHKVSKETHPAWIYRTCASADDARAVETALHNLGCDGGVGGGDATTVLVYAYLKVGGITAP